MTQSGHPGPAAQSHTRPEKYVNLRFWGARDMRRREFFTLVGGVSALPLTAVHAQQSAMPTVGVLWPGAEPPAPPRMESFRQALRQLGYVEGQNLAIELRYARSGLQQLPELAAELVRMKVDVITAFGDLTPKIAAQATSTIPIVAISDDIVGAGLVGSLSRPRGTCRFNNHVSGAQCKASRTVKRDRSRNFTGGGTLGSDDRSLTGCG